MALDIYDRAIIRILRGSRVPLSANNVSKELRISPTTATQHLRELRKLGHVDYETCSDNRVQKTKKTLAKEAGRSQKGKRGRTHKWYVVEKHE